MGAISCLIAARRRGERGIVARGARRAQSAPHRTSRPRGDRWQSGLEAALRAAWPKIDLPRPTNCKLWNLLAKAIRKECGENRNLALFARLSPGSEARVPRQGSGSRRAADRPPLRCAPRLCEHGATWTPSIIVYERDPVAPEASIRLPQVAAPNRVAYGLWEEWVDVRRVVRTLGDLKDKRATGDLYVRRVKFEYRLAPHPDRREMQHAAAVGSVAV